MRANKFPAAVPDPDEKPKVYGPAPTVPEGIGPYPKRWADQPDCLTWGKPEGGGVSPDGNMFMEIRVLPCEPKHPRTPAWVTCGPANPLNLTPERPSETISGPVSPLLSLIKAAYGERETEVHAVAVPPEIAEQLMRALGVKGCGHSHADDDEEPVMGFTRPGKKETFH